MFVPIFHPSIRYFKKIRRVAELATHLAEGSPKLMSDSERLRGTRIEAAEELFLLEPMAPWWRREDDMSPWW